MANEDLIVFTFLRTKHFCQVTFIYIALYAIENFKVTFTIIWKISESVMQTYEMNSNSALNR